MPHGRRRRKPVEMIFPTNPRGPNPRWVQRLLAQATQAGLGTGKLMLMDKRRCRVRIEACRSCRIHGQQTGGCEVERRWLELAASRIMHGTTVEEHACDPAGDGACVFDIVRPVRLTRKEQLQADRIERTKLNPNARRAFMGGLIGAACGFVTYWIGAAIVAATVLAATPVESLPGELSRPMNTFTYWELCIVATGALIGAAVGRYRWRIAGLMSFVALLSLTAGYLAYSLAVSIPQVPVGQRWLSYLLLAAETAGLGLVVIFSFYSVDAATRRRWARTPRERPWDPDFKPKIALQVPVFNEPAEMVEQTIAHLLQQDYPKDRFVVVVADDSTDEVLRERLKAFCERNGAYHVTRTKRHGFKAGALNHVTNLLAPDIELIGIVDADYWVDSDFVSSLVGHFIDPSIGFLQTPQDYRNEGESFLTRQYKRAEAYFYHAIMPSRNEENAIIFCGTMGIIRRSAFNQVGGFAEDQICEDAEISVRLVASGWNSLYVDRTYGHGLMPAVFEAYKKQFHRWAFGNVKILFSRFGTILGSRMHRRQKLDYLVSNLHWFDGIFVATIAGILLYLGLGTVLGYDAVTHHQRELVLLSLVPIFLLVDSVVRLHLVLANAGHIRVRDALMVQGMWFAIKFTNLVAVLKCILGFKTPFVRTPKDPGHRLGRFAALFRAVRIAKVETLVGMTLVTVAGLNLNSVILESPTLILLPAWLALYGLFFLCAPIYAYLSYRSLAVMTYQGIPLGVNHHVDSEPDMDAHPRRMRPLQAVRALAGAGRR